MKQLHKFCTVAAFTLAASTAASAGETTAWGALSSNCGKAFAGTIVKDTDPSDTWTNARIIMHIRDCSENEIKVPLHVDDNRSRIWIVTKLPAGKMRLKHDHRHQDGRSDDVTMYGGTSVGGDGADRASTVAFPVDKESITSFKKYGLEASVTNSWHLSVGETTFHYKLTRPSGREFEVAFDLSKPVAIPANAWDMSGESGH